MQQLIEQVVLTGLNERVNRPGYGCGIEQLLFQPDYPETQAVVQHQVAGSLRQSLGHVADFTDISVTSSGGIMAIDITYALLPEGSAGRVTVRRPVSA